MTQAIGPRDLLVNLIGKAISTGRKVEAHKSPRDNAFYAGRVSAFVHAGAMVVDLMYAGDFEATRHRILKEVEDVHLSWSDADLKDPAKVGNQSDDIATRVLDEA